MWKRCRSVQGKPMSGNPYLKMLSGFLFALQCQSRVKNVICIDRVLNIWGFYKKMFFLKSHIMG